MQATHAELFEPPLPAGKLRAMEGLSTGVVDKIFLDYGGAGGSCPPAWGNPVVAYHLLWDETWDRHLGENGHAAGSEVRRGLDPLA
jgi:hypothetical protein